jgi:hypothetical protein
MRLSNQANLRNGSVDSVVQPSAKCWAWPGARIQVASLVIMLALLFTSAAQLAAHSFKTIDYPGATYTYAYGINAYPQIVGKWEDASFSGRTLSPQRRHGTIESSRPKIESAASLSNMQTR